MLEFKQTVKTKVERVDKVEALQRESATMRSIGSWVSVLTIIATIVLARFADVTWAALAGTTGALVAAVTLTRKLIDDRALSQRKGGHLEHRTAETT